MTKILKTLKHFITEDFPVCGLEIINGRLMIIQKVIDLSPEHSKAYYWRAFSYNSMQKTDDAIKDYSKSIEFEPDFTNAYNDRGLSYIDKKKIMTRQLLILTEQ